MKKCFLFISISLLLLLPRSFATSPDKVELLKELDERQALFARYSASLSKHSGIFGNRTKNDLRESQARLKEIIDADNKIIATLQRTLDFRDFEKVSQTYNTHDFEERVSNLSTVNDSLLSKVNQFEKENKTFRRHSGEGKLLQIFLFVALIGSGFYILRLRKKISTGI